MEYTGFSRLCGLIPTRTAQNNAELTLYMWKSPSQAWLLAAVNKDSYESFKDGLFTSNDATKAEVCTILFAETSKKNMSQTILTHKWLERERVACPFCKENWRQASTIYRYYLDS